MSTVIFVSQHIPEPKLVKRYKFKAYLSPDKKEEILKELKPHLLKDIENYIITMHVDIDVKEYDTKDT